MVLKERARQAQVKRRKQEEEEAKAWAAARTNKRKKKSSGAAKWIGVADSSGDHGCVNGSWMMSGW